MDTYILHGRGSFRNQ